LSVRLGDRSDVIQKAGHALAPSHSCLVAVAFLRAARLSHRNSVQLSVRHTGGSVKNDAS